VADIRKDKYFIPKGQHQPFVKYGTYSQAANHCMKNNSVLADISARNAFSQINSYVNSTSGLPSKTPQLWIGIKRKKKMITRSISTYIKYNITFFFKDIFINILQSDNYNTKLFNIRRTLLTGAKSLKGNTRSSCYVNLLTSRYYI